MSCDPKHHGSAIVVLEVNGKNIELNNFVQGFISQTISGMVRSLKGVDESETISLKISKK